DLDELGRDRGGDPADGEGQEVLGQAAVGFAVGGDDVLVDAPGRLDRGVTGVSEQCLDPLDLARLQQPSAGEQSAPSGIERIALHAAATEDVLLDAAPADVQGFTGQADYVEGIHDRGGVGDLLGGGCLEPSEAVH